MTPEEAKEIIRKYEAGEATKAEKALLEAWYAQWNQDADPPGALEIMAAQKAVWHRLQSEKANPKRFFRYIPYAAAIFLVLATGLWYFFQQRQVKLLEVQSTLAADIVPGKDKAILTLADGTTIDLSTVGAGEVADQSGIRIAKTADNELIYHAYTEAASPTKNLYNTISTPYGGQYQIVLPDGSKVWMNAGSSLRYPVRFASDFRQVELQGEAYFEVQKNDKPFQVLSNGQKVEVLGTHFNINAYEDEPAIVTTLLEGSVRVTSPMGGTQTSKLLKPGQQSIYQSGRMTVRDVDTKNYIGWKNNLIVFESQSLGNIMRQVARWYNVDVVFEDANLAGKRFSGSISKYENVSQVLDMLTLTGLVHFEIEERRITVMK